MAWARPFASVDDQICAGKIHVLDIGICSSAHLDKNGTIMQDGRQGDQNWTTLVVNGNADIGPELSSEEDKKCDNLLEEEERV